MLLNRPRICGRRKEPSQTLRNLKRKTSELEKPSCDRTWGHQWDRCLSICLLRPAKMPHRHLQLLQTLQKSTFQILSFSGWSGNLHHIYNSSYKHSPGGSAALTAACSKTARLLLDSGLHRHNRTKTLQKRSKRQGKEIKLLLLSSVKVKLWGGVRCQGWIQGLRSCTPPPHVPSWRV